MCHGEGARRVSLPREPQNRSVPSPAYRGRLCAGAPPSLIRWRGSGLQKNINGINYGVRVVLCWQTSVHDSTARNFTKRVYELSYQASGQFATAFETAWTELLSGALEKQKARPCLLQTESGQEERKIWNGKKLVTIADEHLHSLVPVEPKPILLEKKPKKKPNNVTLASTLKERVL